MTTVNEIVSKSIADIIEYYKPVGGKIAELDDKFAILSNLQVSLDQFPLIAPENNDSPRLQRAIDSVKTNEYTEAIPTNVPKAIVRIPAGIYKIASKVTIPSYITVEGAGRDVTILESYITNGDPVLLITQNESIKQQQFYNSLKKLTINGRGQVCQGIKILNTSRWLLSEVMIDGTLNEGLYMYESYLGEIYSCLIRACGDTTHYSVKYDGRDSNNGCHAVRMYGGEVNGGGTSVNGVHLKYGNSVGFIGTTIEGFSTGIGILNENGLATVVNGCYFEKNKGHIENTSVYSPNYIGNLFGQPTTGAVGHIIIKDMYGGKIEGNFFGGTGFDHLAAKDATVKLQYSSIRGNYVSGFPIRISIALINSAKQTGTVIETFNASLETDVYGRMKYIDVMNAAGGLRATGGISRISSDTGPSITAGNGSPEAVVSASVGSLYLRMDGGAGTSLYVKESGNGAIGWVAK